MDKKNTGLRIMKMREMKQYTRERMAEGVGISVKFLYEIELGKKGISASTLYRLANILNVSCDYC